MLNFELIVILLFFLLFFLLITISYLFLSLFCFLIFFLSFLSLPSSSRPLYIPFAPCDISSIVLVISREQCFPLPHFVHACFCHYIFTGLFCLFFCFPPVIPGLFPWNLSKSIKDTKKGGEQSPPFFFFRVFYTFDRFQGGFLHPQYIFPFCSPLPFFPFSYLFPSPLLSLSLSFFFLFLLFPCRFFGAATAAMPHRFRRACS